MAIISNLVVQAMICKAFEPHDLVGAFAVWADRLRRRLVRDSRAAELVFLAFLSFLSKTEMPEMPETPRNTSSYGLKVHKGQHSVNCWSFQTLLEKNPVLGYFY